MSGDARRDVVRTRSRAKGANALAPVGTVYGDVIGGMSLAYAAHRRGIAYVDAQAEYFADVALHRAARECAPDVERARLERLLLALQPGIGSGDVAAIREARAVSESLRKLDGLDAQRDATDGAVAVTVRIALPDGRATTDVPTADGDAGRPAAVPVDRDWDENR